MIMDLVITLTGRYIVGSCIMRLFSINPPGQSFRLSHYDFTHGFCSLEAAVRRARVFSSDPVTPNSCGQ